MMRIPFAAIAFALAMAAVAKPAAASTALEKKILTYPMAHTVLPTGGPRVKVHYTRIRTDAQGDKTVEGLVKGIKNEIALCVALRHHMKAPANPPADLPDYLLGSHKDTYVARNREIVYTRHATYKMNDDCSITESEYVEAILSSSKGSCQIDFTNKTATGYCDQSGHADAVANPPVPRMSAAESNAHMASMARDPRTAQYVKQMRTLLGNHVGSTGGKKVILGIECEVTSLSGPMASTRCVAHPLASTAAGDAGAGLLLESRSEHGNANAVEVKLDADVSSAVFVPYAAGFKITAQ